MFFAAKTHYVCCWTDVSLLGKVCQNKCSFLLWEFVFLHPEFLQQLPAGDRENGLEETAAEYLACLISWQTVITLRDVTVAQPPAEHTHTLYNSSTRAGYKNINIAQTNYIVQKILIPYSKEHITTVQQQKEAMDITCITEHENPASSAVPIMNN